MDNSLGYGGSPVVRLRPHCCSRNEFKLISGSPADVGHVGHVLVATHVAVAKEKTVIPRIDLSPLPNSMWSSIHFQDDEFPLCMEQAFRSEDRRRSYHSLEDIDSILRFWLTAVLMWL